MDLFFRRLGLRAIFSFCLSVDNVNPETGASITSFLPMSVLVRVCLIRLMFSFS